MQALSSLDKLGSERREFSLHQLIATKAQENAIPMRQLGRKDDALDLGHTGSFDASVRAMHYWCKLNEKLLLDRHASGARVYAGFERLSRVAPVAHRYALLAGAVQRLSIFGEPDAQLSFAARTVDVTDTALAREWFLVIDSPSYKTLLVARDQRGFGPNGPLAGRRFVGVSTHDAQLVRVASTALERWL